MYVYKIKSVKFSRVIALDNPESNFKLSIIVKAKVFLAIW